FIWDLLSNIPAEWHLFCTSRNKLYLMVYVMSRISSMIFVLGRAIYATYPVGNCKIANITIDSLYAVGVPGSCLLLLFRACAVYHDRRKVIAFFAFLWVAVLGVCLGAPFSSLTANIQSTSYCIITRVRPFVGAIVIVPTVYDTVIFVAVSYKLMSHGFARPRGLLERILGNNLPEFSRAMFRDSQKYYLITVLGNLFSISLIYAPASADNQIAINVPNAMLTNIMACYVYRNTVLGYDPTRTIEARIISTQQADIPIAMNTPSVNNGPSATGSSILVETRQITHSSDKS
ncbi:hypothetical protein GYMLUDRAFT_179525, partial [Collybiopsis luxurians FD-317 M1]